MKNKLFCKVYSLIFSFCLFFILSSCEVFVTSVHGYLNKYSQQIYLGDVVPEVDYAIDRYGNKCIPSSKDEDFIFYVTYANPANHEVQFMSKIPGYAWERITDFKIPDGFYYKAPTDVPNQYKLCFAKNYLTEKDKPGANREIEVKLCFIDKTLTNDDTEVDEDDSETRTQTKIYTLKCNVNTRPEIIYDDTFDDSPTLGTYTDDENNSCYFLCFNLKPETQSNACFYNDLKDSSGNYNLNINGTDYPFKFVNGKPVFQSDSFKSSKVDLPPLNYFNPDFETKDNLVYFLTGKKVSEFNITVTDEDGLSARYIVSGATSGKYKLTNPTASQNGDEVTIRTDCIANAISGSGSTTAKNVSVEYTLNGVTKTIPVQGGKASIYIPGGTSTITYKTTCGSRGDIKPSDAQTFESHLDNKLYVTPSPENADWAGGSSSHPTTLTKAVACLNGKDGEWELHMAAGESDYEATKNDMVTGCENCKTWIHITGPSKVTISGPSAQNHATIDAKGKGRVLSTYGTNLEIQNVNFTGGFTFNGSNGGGLYVENADLSLNNCTIYDNTSSNSGGGIYFKSSSPNILSVKNSTIGDIQNPNYANSDGGGIYISLPKSESTIYFENSLIGSTETGDEYKEEFANIADLNNGGGIMIDYGDSPDGSVSAFFKETKIMKNKAFNDGGGIYIAQKKTVTFDYDCEVSYNNANSQGGGIFLEYVSGRGIASVKLGDVDSQELPTSMMQVNNNEAYEGAAVYCTEYNMVYINNTQINNNITTKVHGNIVCFEKNSRFFNFNNPNTKTEIQYNKDNQNGWAYAIYFKENMANLTPGDPSSDFNFLLMEDKDYFYIPVNAKDGNNNLMTAYFTYGATPPQVTSTFTLVSKVGTKYYRRKFTPSDNLNGTNNQIQKWDEFTP